MQKAVTELFTIFDRRFTIFFTKQKIATALQASQ
jgi:hypothetical protein